MKYVRDEELEALFQGSDLTARANRQFLVEHYLDGNAIPTLAANPEAPVGYESKVTCFSVKTSTTS